MSTAVITLDRVSRALAENHPHASSDYDLNPEVRDLLPANRSLRPAAVLVPLIARGDRLAVVLTRRSSRLKHHPGQIAFPGGKLEAEDSSPWDGALREAREEIGLPPETVRRIGALDRHETVTRFDVEPHVGLVEGGFSAAPDHREVDEVFEVPLDFLLDPANYQTHARLWQGRPRQYYVVPYGPYYIWGATARILKGFSDRVRAA